MATFSILEPESEMAEATWASTPREFFTSTSRRTSNKVPGEDSHSTSIHFCGS